MIVALIFALATANVAAMPLATLVGSKDVDATYPGARLDCPLSLVSFRWLSSLVRGGGGLAAWLLCAVAPVARACVFLIPDTHPDTRIYLISLFNFPRNPWPGSTNPDNLISFSNRPRRPPTTRLRVRVAKTPGSGGPCLSRKGWVVMFRHCMDFADIEGWGGLEHGFG